MHGGNGPFGPTSVYRPDIRTRGLVPGVYPGAGPGWFRVGVRAGARVRRAGEKCTDVGRKDGCRAETGRSARHPCIGPTSVRGCTDRHPPRTRLHRTDTTPTDTRTGPSRRGLERMTP